MKKTRKQPVYSGTIGKRIFKCEEVVKAAQQGKSLWHSRLGRPTSAAWLQNMPTHLIVGYLRMGWLYQYKPAKK